MRSQKFAVHSGGMADDGERAERELLARKLRESGMSARKAAEKMRITDTRLRHIINGYQPVGRGQRIEVVAPADTLADIALALEITPAELVEAGRSDAAVVLEKILGARPMEYAEPGDRQWNQILANHAEIREWAEEGIELYMPPDVILELFTDDQLLGEIGRRIRYGSPFGQPMDDATEGGDGNAEADSPRGPAPTSQGDYDLAAYDDEHTIEEEQEHPDTP